MGAVQLASSVTINTWNINSTGPVANSIVEFPFQAYFANSETNEVLCGASILSSLVILTAASCLAGKNISELAVVAGDQRHSTQEGSEQKIPVSDVYIHQGFNSRADSFDNDLAVAFLLSNLSFNRHVDSIEIPFERWRYDGSETIYGWAKSPGNKSNGSNLDIASIPIISPAECASIWNLDELHPDKYICVNKTETNALTDFFGGPLPGSFEGVPILLGVATKRLVGSAEQNYDKPSIYTNLAQYRPWIHGMLHHPTRLNLIGCSAGEIRSNYTFECIPNDFLYEGGNDCGRNCPPMEYNIKNCNADGKFWCPSSKKCIPRRFVCDGHFSCDNAEDELNCSPQKCTELNRFWCSQSSKCIPYRLVCDGYHDCRNSEDEMNCGPSNCTEDARFWCSGSSICIPASNVCNGNNDCINNEDEVNCETSGMCSEEEFKCLYSYKCIRKELVCNGENDCGNYSDEVNCTLTNTTRTCSASEFKCLNSPKCLTFDILCDGENDCGNNYDELDCDKRFCDKLGRFWCRSLSKCIRASQICDGINNCGNNEDEINCTNVTLCSEGEFRCLKSTKCIPNRHLCDGDDHCGNNSDEVNCTTSRTCDEGQFKCAGSQKCIPNERVCNGNNDCDNNSDEINCAGLKKCDVGQFECTNSSKCIPRRNVCDGDNDCGNNSDEVNCTTSKSCDVGQFMCTGSYKCISVGYVCDGDDDCGNNSDEVNCTILKRCTAEQFKCLGSSQCIPNKFLCDGEDDCGENEDESNCNLTNSDRRLYSRNESTTRTPVDLTSVVSLPRPFSVMSATVQDLAARNISDELMLFMFFEEIHEESKESIVMFQQYQRLLDSMRGRLMRCDIKRGMGLTELMETLLLKHRLRIEEKQREFEGFIKRQAQARPGDRGDPSEVVVESRKEFRRSIERFQQYQRLLGSLKNAIVICRKTRFSTLIEVMETLLQQHRMEIEETQRNYGRMRKKLKFQASAE